MNVNEQELFQTLEAGLQALLPLPDQLMPAPGYVEPARPESSGGYFHQQSVGWREIVTITHLPGFGQKWLLVPLSGGRVVLAWATAVAQQHHAAAVMWQELALPVLLSLTEQPEKSLQE